jgi:hypothetical protein
MIGESGHLHHNVFSGMASTKIYLTDAKKFLLFVKTKSPCPSRYNASGTGARAQPAPSTHAAHPLFLAVYQRRLSPLPAPIPCAGQDRQAPGEAEGSESAGSPQLAGYFFSLRDSLSN